jgi:hypothetical protein
LKKVSPEEVRGTFVVRQQGVSPDEYAAALAKVIALSPEEQAKLGRCAEYAWWSWPELFGGSVEWSETELDPGARVVNRFYDSVLRQRTSFLRSLAELIEDYEKGRIIETERALVDRIRKSLRADPRVIAVTRDSKEFAIYDGWHTAIAFALEKKPLPVYLGVARRLRCYGWRWSLKKRLRAFLA